MAIQCKPSRPLNSISMSECLFPPKESSLKENSATWDVVFLRSPLKQPRAPFRDLSSLPSHSLVFNMSTPSLHSLWDTNSLISDFALCSSCPGDSWLNWLSQLWGTWSQQICSYTCRHWHSACGVQFTAVLRVEDLVTTVFSPVPAQLSSAEKC